MASALEKLQMDEAIARMSPELRAHIQAKANSEQRSVLPLPYWSTIRFTTVRAGAAPFTYTADTSPKKAFAYANGQDMSVAGFAAGTIAGFAETNLLKQSETLDNADVVIWGLACELCPNSDPVLASQIFRDAFVEMSLNGTNSFRIGTLGMFPSAGGLYGLGNTKLRAPATNTPGNDPVSGGAGPQVGFVSNGNGQAGNYYKFPQPFTWAGLGGDGKDTTLTITTTLSRSVVVTAPAARAAVAVVAMVTPGTIEPYIPPAADATPFVDLRWRLICVSISRRSVNT